ncbi:MAG TPA: amino acid adenylation domain-containing protein, partial [Ktedonobacteraceae bacterium]
MMDEIFAQKAIVARESTDDQDLPDVQRAPTSAYPREHSLHQWFEDQVERTPDAIALISEHTHLTYDELDRRANRLAAILHQRGIGPDILVGLCLPRTPDLLIALLAILKACAAYVPLDPNYPTERLSFILNDARVTLVLTESSCLSSLPPQEAHNIPYLCLDTLIQEITYRPEALPRRTGGENLAYVIYTSGSTGRPKGVAIAHRNISAFLAWAQATFPSHLLGGVLASTSICFDLSLFELFLPWSCGGTVILTQNALHLPTHPAAHAVTLLNTVPSVLAALLQNGPLPTSVRTVTLAGEALPASLVHALYTQPGVQQVYNLYGPSEDTTYSTWALLSAACEEPVPIGQPISNTQCYVLDPAGQPVPPGASGELYLGGAGLARGYLGQPALTAERFVPHPWSSQPGARLYRTGDLVRALLDGRLTFVGRLDTQVKLRGYRIELGEIEAILRQHPLVRQAAVILHTPPSSEPHLVAYVVATHPALSQQTLRAFLSERLPDYMLPTLVVWLDQLPLTPNGKLDRQALPAPDWTSLASGDNESPRTQMEEVLVGIWQEVLGLPGVGIHDNFFLLGGHSLLATRVVSRIRSILQVELPLDTLFTNPTVAEIARLLEHKTLRAEQNQPSVTLQASQPSGHAPLSFPQERVWFLQQLHPTSIAYHFQATLTFTGTLDIAALERSLNEIIRRHQAMRTTFPAVHGQPVQVIHPPYQVNLPLIELQELPEDARAAEQQRLIQSELQKHFDLTRLPLARWLLLRLHKQKHVLVHVEHHLIHDGWSFNTFLKELTYLYQAFSQDRPSPLAELPMQFADFARWQRQWMQGGVAAAQLDYWKKQLEGSKSLLQLPTDRPRAAVQSSQGAAPRVELPPDLCDALRALSRQEGVTLFMTMLAAFLVLLYRYTNQADISIGTGIANRRWSETEGLIGMLINTLVLRARPSDTLTFRDFLIQVRGITLEAYAHQDLPFDQVVQALQPARNLDHNPLFQVVFAFHDSQLPPLELPELKVELVEALSNGSAKFDLNLIVIPRSEQSVGHRAEGTPRSITIIWEYSTDLFDETTVTRMARHYQRILESIVADPRQGLGALPLLTQAELQTLLVDWNATERVISNEQLIHRGFELQFERTPDAIAVLTLQEHLTYAELNRRAEQLAGHLRQQGIGPDMPVALCLPRSLDLVIALLAVLKAGGAYLLLDPIYPVERLRWMLLDSRAPLLLTLSSQLALFPALDLPILCLDQPLDAPSMRPQAVPSPQMENLAYIIYTSGSTGLPKGTLLTHKSLLNLVTWHQEAFALSTRDRASHLAGLSFDAATWELWPYLLCGACLCLLDEQTRLSPPLLQRWLEREAITIGFLPTPLAEQLLMLDWSRSTTLRAMLVGGDLLHPVTNRSLPFALVNNYGPSEYTVVATSSPVSTATNDESLPSIGQPISNTQCYVLDPAGQPVPPGASGELYLGGAGLARGYLGQ